MTSILNEPGYLIQVGGFIVAELLAVILFFFTASHLANTIFKRMSASISSTVISEKVEKSRRFSRSLITVAGCLAVLALLGFNGWAIYLNKNPLTFSLELLYSVPNQTWVNLGLGLIKIIAAFVAAKYISRALQQLIDTTEKRTLAATTEENQAYIVSFFMSLRLLVRNVVWMLAAIFIIMQIAIPAWVESLLFKAVSIYIIIGIGLIAARTVAVVVSVLDNLSSRFAAAKQWHEYYNALKPLVPLLRRSLEYAIWIASATLVLSLLTPFAYLAEYGPRLIQSIGIFFLAKVFIEAGNLVIDIKKDNIDENDQMAIRRRDTIAPLIKTVFRYVAFFITLVLILGSLGIDIMPFLAGAGILGVVIGLGAQSLINDIVSGFFILFENTYLVGDIIDTGDVLGTVVQIDFRTTRLRDPDGNLHTLRNGDISRTKNFCKEFTFAVVEVRADYKSDVADIRAQLEKSGEEVKAALPELVTGEIDVKGIVEFEPSAMRFRTTTPVIPGKHFAVATRLREIIKSNFDQKGIIMPPLQQQISFKKE
jgi:small conductance mechanosensitive channel